MPFSKGKLTKVSSSVLETRYNSFDNLGRVLNSAQLTDGQTYNSAYTYNLSGALIEQTYPSGRVVKNTLDQDGDLQQVQSAKSNGTLQNYANSFNYTAAGAVSAMRLGNGRWENTTFNSRLQPTQIGLGGSATSQNLLKLNYEYGATASGNNGNISKQTISVPTETRGNVTYAAFTAIQTYTYDSLNRIKDAKEMIGATQEWKQTFQYDRFGNRNFVEDETTTILKNCGTLQNPTVCAADVPKVNPSVNLTNNRLNGTTFDNAGNTTVDASGQTFVYDAENKQVQVTNAGGINKYFYDGDGKRVKKYVPSTGETTIFVYDASGKTVAEYSTMVESQTSAKISYLTNDHLGSPRITTDANGTVISRRDFLPFGEEISRASYGADKVRQKFTGYERDAETDLDFAQARMYSKNRGRFTTPDEPFMDQYEYNPQSWNLYSYTRNNPLNFIDPTGEAAISAQKTCPPDCSGEINLPEVVVTIGIGKVVKEVLKKFKKKNDSDTPKPQPQPQQPQQKSWWQKLLWQADDDAIPPPPTPQVQVPQPKPVPKPTRLLQFSTSTVENSVKKVMSDPFKVSHIFDPKHTQVTGLVNQLGGRENTVRAVINGLNGKLPANGVFNETVVVQGTTLRVNGAVVDGLIRIGTMW